MKTNHLVRYRQLILLLVLLLVATVALPTSAQEATLLVFDPETTSVNIGDTFTVNVQVQTDSSQEVNAAEVYIDFDNTVLEVVTLTASDELAQPFKGPLTVDGTIDYAAGNIPAIHGDNPVGSFTLLTIEFEAIASGVVTLDFSEVPGRDSRAYFAGIELTAGADNPSGTVTVNSAPVANDDSATTDEDVAVSIDVLDNDSDLDGDNLEISSVSTPSNGSAVLDNGEILYTPNADFNGSDSFTYEISDGNGGTDTAEVTVTVTAVNDDPVAEDDSATTNEDVAVSIDVLDNDSDLDDDTLEISSVGTPGNGSAVVDNGEILYTPNADFNGSDSFTYEISDGNGGTDTAEVTVTVTAVNDDPVAEDDSATTNEDVAVSIDVLDNDSDLDGDTLEISSIGTPSNGSAVVDNDEILYTPGTDFYGTAFFTYEISDGNGGSDTATVTVTINAADATLEGSIDIPGRVDNADELTITIYEAGTATQVGSAYVVTTTEEGSFILPDVELNQAALYDVAFKTQNTLQMIVEDVALQVGANAPLDPVELTLGDINNDNYINLADFSIFSNVYDLSVGDAGYIAAADLTNQGKIDLQDFSIFSRNYDLVGDIPGA